MPTKTDLYVVFEREFRADLRYWIETDRKKAFRIMTLVEDAVSTPFTGLGKPEPLKHEFAGAWSRRITQEHRLVYRVYSDRIAFLAALYRY